MTEYTTGNDDAATTTNEYPGSKYAPGGSDGAQKQILYDIATRVASLHRMTPPTRRETPPAAPQTGK